MDFDKFEHAKKVKQINSFWDLEELGRIRLSENYYARDFLYSEIGSFYKVQNIPQNIDLFVEAGTCIAQKILEPLRKTFGNVALRSGYRSKELNGFGNKNNLKCASNESNYAQHIWDEKDKNGNIGAVACIFIPWFNDRFKNELEFTRLAIYLNHHLAGSYNEITFFSRQDCFNIGYRTNPERNIFTTKEPKGQMFKNGEFICERLGYDKETDRIILQNEHEFKYEKLTSGLFGNGLDLMDLCKGFPEWKS